MLSDGLARRLEARLVTAQRDWRAPGVSAGVVRGGRLAWSGHAGSARLGEAGVPATDETQFMIGSVTKTFTALAVMSLRDEGRLTLDDLLGTYLPGTRHARVPIRQMLAHASGLQREPVGRIWESLEAPDRHAFLAGVEQAEQVLPAHHAFHYSNLADGLLGQLVERVTGQDWEVVVRERVLGPLGMTRTGLAPADDRARGYQVDPYSGTATEEPVFTLNATAPLGGLWSTVADMVRYAAYIACPDSRVVRPETIEEMCRPIILSDPDGWTGGYGLGFGMGRRGERVYVGHGGAMPGYLTGLRVRRKDGLGAIVFANCTSGAEPLVLATDLIDVVLDAEPSLPQPWQPEATHPDFAPLLGLWWSEGSPITFFVRGGALWSRLTEIDPLSETRYAAEGPDRFRAVEGRERGEVLEVVRAEDGSVARLYFATYAVTRRPLAFADLQA
ncbi:MAG: beta-lactamase family protein [Intrasporangium sp.]|uniref:serine hydrolase domain-containing protein n=1 Tax=Intrasporangium sp. TaxID=1925024 RepID=UPI00264740AC|nr:serine hydrolase domain-containing protein [Intrasporangium sp.]MDN5796600.1 beta-lactamase family protein [Intrasporangium sp.]